MSFWDVAIVEEDEALSTLRIAFPSREIAIVQILVLADAVEVNSPSELPAQIVERAHIAIQTYR